MPSDYLLALLAIHAHDTLVKTKEPDVNSIEIYKKEKYKYYLNYNEKKNLVSPHKKVMNQFINRLQATPSFDYEYDHRKSSKASLNSGVA